MKTYINLNAGVFYSVDLGHVFLTRDLAPSELNIGQRFQMNSMFDMWELLVRGQPCGYYFQSAFKVENKGSYILTYMVSKMGKADKHTVLMRNDRDGLVVYDFPGCGALAVSTKVSTAMKEILETQ